MAFVNTGLDGKLNRNKYLHFPSVQKPKALGCFSLDANREYVNSGENLSYYLVPETFPLDLNKGYGTAMPRPISSEQGGLHSVLHFICDHRNELLSKSNSSNSKAIHGADFICYRGLLRVIMNTPYERREDWCIQATSYKGNIYLCERRTDCKLQELEQMKNNEMRKRVLSYGLKFEQYCTSPSPYEKPNVNEPVNERTEFHCVFKTQLSGLTLLYGAGIDGVLSGDEYHNVECKEVLRNMKFVELKCSLRAENARQHQNFYRFKTKDWWCQCFLAGIDDLFIGCRNDDGFIDEILHMNVQDLPEISSNFWNPAQCVNFLIKFLRMVKNLMKDVDCPDTVYEFNFNTKSRAIDYIIRQDTTECTLLPDWYTAML